LLTCQGTNSGLYRDIILNLSAIISVALTWTLLPDSTRQTLEGQLALPLIKKGQATNGGDLKHHTNGAARIAAPDASQQGS